MIDSSFLSEMETAFFRFFAETIISKGSTFVKRSNGQSLRLLIYFGP